MEEQNLPFEDTNENLTATALAYSAVLEKAAQFLPSVDQSLLAGTSGTVYLKQKGHRALTSEDSENIIRSLGSQADKKIMRQFAQAQQALSSRLNKNRWIGLICEQSGIPYLKVRRRIAKPDLWKADEMSMLGTVLQRLQL